MHPADAARRGLKNDDPIRIFNDLGEVQCAVKVEATIREGTVSLPKGLWRKSTWNQMTGNVLVPDSLTDLGGGACFNDARVEVARLRMLEVSTQRREDAEQFFLKKRILCALASCAGGSREDAELFVHDRDFVDRALECGRAQVADLGLPRSASRMS